MLRNLSGSPQSILASKLHPGSFDRRATTPSRESSKARNPFDQLDMKKVKLLNAQNYKLREQIEEQRLSTIKQENDLNYFVKEVDKVSKKHNKMIENVKKLNVTKDYTVSEAIKIKHIVPESCSDLQMSEQQIENKYKYLGGRLENLKN